MDDRTRRETMGRLMELAKDYRTSRVLTTAVELEIPERFQDGPRTIEQIRREDEDPEGFRRLVRALAALGILETSEPGQFRAALPARQFLMPDSELDLRPILRLFHKNYELWAELPRAVRDGHDVPSDALEEFEFGREFTLAMECRAHFAKRDVAEVVAPMLSDGRLLDLGGGSGVFAREILHRATDSSAVIADRPSVVERAERLARGTPVEDRLSVRPLDLFEDTDYGNDFDLILLSSITHIYNRDQMRTIFRRSARALKPGGRIVVRDFVFDESEVGPREAVLFDLHMLLASDSGGNSTREEFRTDLESSGFVGIEENQLPGPESLIIAVASTDSTDVGE